MQRGAPSRSLVQETTSRRGHPRMKNLQPAKVLLVAAVIGLGLSGGFAAAAFLPGGTPGTVAQIWDDTVGRAFQNGPGEKGSLFTAAATYIGITEAQLRTEVGTDKSLADVAVAHGKTRDGLIQTLTQIANATAGKNRDGLFNALVADATAKIDAAQKAGTITADQATQQKANLATRIAQFVDTTERRGR